MCRFAGSRPRKLAVKEQSRSSRSRCAYSITGRRYVFAAKHSRLGPFKSYLQSSLDSSSNTISGSSIETDPARLGKFGSLTGLPGPRWSPFSKLLGRGPYQHSSLELKLQIKHVQTPVGTIHVEQPLGEPTRHTHFFDASPNQRPVSHIATSWRATIQPSIADAIGPCNPQEYHSGANVTQACGLAHDMAFLTPFVYCFAKQHKQRRLAPRRPRWPPRTYKDSASHPPLICFLLEEAGAY